MVAKGRGTCVSPKYHVTVEKDGNKIRGFRVDDDNDSAFWMHISI
jgi:hypothetical protein